MGEYLLELFKGQNCLQHISLLSTFYRAKDSLTAIHGNLGYVVSQKEKKTTCGKQQSLPQLLSLISTDNPHSLRLWKLNSVKSRVSGSEFRLVCDAERIPGCLLSRISA